MQWYKKSILVLLCCVTWPLALAEFTWQPQDYTIAITGHYAWIDGFSQIPAGGVPDSASFQRPTFKEVGIESDLYANALFQVDWASWALYAKYQYLRPSDSKALGKALIMRNITLPAGTVLKLNTRFDTYHVGFIAKWWWQDTKLIVSPKLEVVVMNFEFEPKAAGFDLANAYRSFKAVTTRVGTELSYPINHKLSIDGEIMLAMPGLFNLTLYDINAFANYHLVDKGSWSTRLFAGGGFNHLEFKDSQAMPNHMRLTLWPTLAAGLAITF